MDSSRAPALRASHSLSSHESDDEADRFTHLNENQLSSSPELDDGFSDLHGAADGERKSAFYDYKQEKALQQTDAKLFYQPQQGQSPSVGGWNSPAIRGSASAAGGNLSRTASMMSMSSLHQQPQQSGTPGGSSAFQRKAAFGRGCTGLPSLNKPSDNSEVEVSSIGRFDPHGVVEAKAHASSHGYKQLVDSMPATGATPAEAHGGYAYRMYTGLIEGCN